MSPVKKNLLLFKLISLKIVLLVILLSSFGILSACHSSQNTKKIGIIVPLQHKALDEIVAGFTEKLKSQIDYPLEFKIANAQNDINMQRAIIQQMKDENYALIVPVSSVTTQMTLAMIQDKPIISIASSYSKQERKERNPCNVAIVHDDISPEKIITFIHHAYPKLSHLTLIHSASEKIFPDVKLALVAGKNLGIEIKPMMVPALSDLYSIANALPQNTQGILVLRDNMIVSGIGTLAISAAQRQIPLITSDQGSVQEGGAFSLGVHEREIGIKGATLAASVLSGKKICSLPILEMTELTVFVNKDALIKENQNINDIQQTAKKLHYKTEIINGDKT